MGEQKNIPKLRFPGFAGEWVMTKLGNVMTEGRLGGNYKNSEDEEGLPLIKMGNLGRGSINLDKVHYIPIDEEYSEADILNEGDLLFNTRNTLDLVGKVSIWRRELPIALYNSNIMKMVFNSEFESSNKFLNILFNTKKSIKQLRGFATGTTSVAAIYGRDLATFKIRFPSLPEQQKIASFFSAIDKKISQLKQKKTLLEQYKKVVMQKIFTQQIRFRDENGQEFPEWEKKRLGDFLKQELREVDKPNENYLAIGVRSHCRGTFQRENSEPDKIAMDKLYQVREGDLILNITFAWESAIALVEKEDDGGFVSHRFPTYVFKKDEVIGSFFQYVFVQKRFRQMLDLISPGGAGRNRVLNKKDFLKLIWDIPCIEEQTKIANFLSAIDTRINHTQTQIENAELWKKGLLQMMFV